MQKKKRTGVTGIKTGGRHFARMRRAVAACDGSQQSRTCRPHDTRCCCCRDMAPLMIVADVFLNRHVAYLNVKKNAKTIACVSGL